MVTVEDRWPPSWVVFFKISGLDVPETGGIEAGAWIVLKEMSDDFLKHVGRRPLGAGRRVAIILRTRLVKTSVENVTKIAEQADD